MMTLTTRVAVICLMLGGLSGCAGVVAVGAVSSAVVANDNRTLGTQIDDTTADFEIAAALGAHDDLYDYTNISGIVMNQNTLLVGQAPNSMLRDKATTVVKQLKPQGKIFNQIRIGSPTSFTTRSNDAWITTKVKSQMLSHGGVDVTRVKVVTENGEVFLLGLVSREQGKLAAEVASTTTGVRKVVKVFEYTN